ncbi:alpha/beta hydrolase [Candidatus Saccharibacteria bacterium]|nr:alpha/beta hydrolase [Candidatus Saccharibacteria bacterium]
MNISHGTLDIPDDPTPWVLVSPSDDKTWCVLWLQGWTSTIDGHLEGITRMAEASGITFAMMDYAGHGSHPIPLANSTKKQQLTECLAAYDQLTDLGYERIIVIGGSFGGYTAALLAGERPAAAVILRAPAAYPDHEFELPYTETAESDKRYSSILNVDEELTSSAFNSIASYAGPVYVCEHEKDEVVPRQIPQEYFRKAQHGNYLLVPNTEHSPKTMTNPRNTSPTSSTYS